jgi:hypothetical protein
VARRKSPKLVTPRPIPAPDLVERELLLVWEWVGDVDAELVVLPDVDDKTAEREVEPRLLEDPEEVDAEALAVTEVEVPQGS